MQTLLIAASLFTACSCPDATVSDRRGATARPLDPREHTVDKIGKNDRTQPNGAEVELAAPRDLEQAIAVGDVHRYRLELAANSYVHLVVEQLGADVALRVAGPAWETLLEIDSPNGSKGPEPLWLWSAAGGPHHLLIQALATEPHGGRYHLRLIELRTATEHDRRQAAAARTFAQAEELRRSAKGEGLAAAIEQYKRAAALWGELGHTEQQANAFKQLGRAFNLAGRRRDELDANREAMALFDRIGLFDHRYAALLNSTGAACRYLGELDAAERYYDEALRLQRRLGDGAGEAVTLNNLGRLSSARGAMREALNWYQLALERWQLLSDRSLEATALTNMGGIYESLGEGETARDFYQRALLLLPPEDTRQLALVVDSLADVSQELGAHAEALAYYDRALALWRRLGDRISEAYTLNGKGRLHLRHGELDAAHTAFDEAQGIFASLADLRGESIVLHGQGRLEHERGDLDQALVLYRRSLTLASNVRYATGEAAALLGAARVERERDRLEAAWAHVERAIAISESLREGAERIDLRTSFFATRQEYYDVAIDIAMLLHQRSPDRGHDAHAYEVSERSRARGLLDTLPRSGVSRRRVDPMLLARERWLQDALNAAGQERTYRGEDDELETGAGEARLRNLLNELHAVRTEIHRGSVSETATLPQVRPLTLAEIRRQVLDDKTILLHFDLGDEASYLWIVTATSLHGFALPGRSEIEPAAREVHELLAASQNRLARHRAEQAAARWSTRFLPHLVELPTARRLLIVAEGALQYLPFGALPLPAATNLSPDAREPLLARYEIVFAPSASVVAWVRRSSSARPTANGLLAVLADPVFARDDPRLHSDIRGLEADSSNSEASDRGRLAGFERLPRTRQEAEAILALATGEPTFHAFDFNASRETVLSGVLANYRIVHFATHGVLDARHPELSGVVLSLVDAAGRPVDGYLRVHEIENLRLSADLVVLSACQTALGAETRGEGLVGLTHGFLRAGASRLLVSLWNVDDRSTAELMASFYTGLLHHGLAPAAALRQAQLAMRQSARWSAPYFWAGFVLQGDG